MAAWQRGTNENTIGLLRQYFPKGTDLSRWSAREIHTDPRTGKERFTLTAVVTGSNRDKEAVDAPTRKR